MKEYDVRVTLGCGRHSRGTYLCTSWSPQHRKLEWWLVVTSHELVSDSESANVRGLSAEYHRLQRKLQTPSTFKASPKYQDIHTIRV